MVHNSSSISPFPKWQIAIALGCTGVIGLGYWYMRHYSSMEKSKKPNLLEMAKKQSGSVDETGTIDSDKTAPKTPLQIAIDFKNEGNNFFKKGAYDKAIECYTKAIDACPLENATEISTFFQNRAACYEHLKKHSSVIDDCTKALEFKNNYVKALYRRARAYEGIKEWSNCLDDISAVCLLQGFQDQNALLMADRVLKELGRQHAKEEMANHVPITPSRHFIKTYFISFSEDPAYNLITSDELKKITAEQTELKGFLKARKYFLDGNYDEIISACSEEIDSSESDSVYKTEALLLRGTFHLLRGSHTAAIQDLQTVINNDQADIKARVSALVKRASLYMQLERPDECNKDFEEAARLGPDISDVFHHRGQVNLLMEQTAQATEDFNRAVSLNPNFPIAFVQKNYSDYRQALMARDMKRVEQCLKNFEASIERFPSCSECYVLYAQVLADEQKFDRCNQLYDRVLKFDNGNATVYVHKGMLELQSTGNVEKAINLIKDAIRIDPLCEYAFETLATIEVQRGHLDEAIELFDKAIKLAKTELEMSHLFSLRDAANSQRKISKKLGITLPSAMLNM